jgi:hypothetical protein
MDMTDKKQRTAAVEVVKEALEVTKNETTSVAAKEFLTQNGG